LSAWGIPCAGNEVYAPRHRAEWLAKINEPGVPRRAEFYYQQLDVLRALRQEARRDLMVESMKDKAWKLLRQIPEIGPNPSDPVGRADSDASPIPYQATSVDLERSGIGNA